MAGVLVGGGGAMNTQSITNVPLNHVKRPKCSLMPPYKLQTHPKGAPCLQPTAGIGSSTLPVTLNEVQHRLIVANLKNIVCLCRSHMFYQTSWSFLKTFQAIMIISTL